MDNYGLFFGNLVLPLAFAKSERAFAPGAGRVNCPGWKRSAQIARQERNGPRFRLFRYSVQERERCAVVPPSGGTHSAGGPALCTSNRKAPDSGPPSVVPICGTLWRVSPTFPVFSTTLQESYSSDG